MMLGVWPGGGGLHGSRAGAPRRPRPSEAALPAKGLPKHELADPCSGFVVGLVGVVPGDPWDHV